MRLIKYVTAVEQAVIVELPPRKTFRVKALYAPGFVKDGSMDELTVHNAEHVEPGESAVVVHNERCQRKITVQAGAGGAIQVVEVDR